MLLLQFPGIILKYEQAFMAPDNLQRVRHANAYSANDWECSQAPARVRLAWDIAAVWASISAAQSIALASDRSDTEGSLHLEFSELIIRGSG
jgi:hypothetical protein